MRRLLGTRIVAAKSLARRSRTAKVLGSSLDPGVRPRSLTDDVMARMVNQKSIKWVGSSARLPGASLRCILFLFERYFGFSIWFHASEMGIQPSGYFLQLSSLQSAIENFKAGGGGLIGIHEQFCRKFTHMEQSMACLLSIGRLPCLKPRSNNMHQYMSSNTRNGIYILIIAVVRCRCISGPCVFK